MYPLPLEDFNIFFNETRIGTDLTIKECGFENCQPSKPTEYIPVDYYIIHYCVHGEGQLTLNNSTYNVSNGDLFLIPPDTSNRYFPKPENPWSYFWIGINGTLAKELLSDCNITKTHCLNHVGINDELIQCYCEIISYISKSKILDAHSSLFHWLQLLSDLAQKAHAASHCSDNYFNDIIQYINENYMRDISIQKLADSFHIDRTYVYKLFKKYTNTNPQQYLIEYRLEKACTLLRRSNLSIAEVGEGSGFHTQAQFSKLFSKKYNISPSQYRKKYIL